MTSLVKKSKASKTFSCLLITLKLAYGFIPPQTQRTSAALSSQATNLDCNEVLTTHHLITRSHLRIYLLHCSSAEIQNNGDIQYPESTSWRMSTVLCFKSSGCWYWKEKEREREKKPIDSRDIKKDMRNNQSWIRSVGRLEICAANLKL